MTFLPKIHGPVSTIEIAAARVLVRLVDLADSTVGRLDREADEVSGLRGRLVSERPDVDSALGTPGAWCLAVFHRFPPLWVAMGCSTPTQIRSD